ncbi:MAG: hypothetical protein J7L95_01655 [Prolixibacteraceae bacterium]|nr:hypothetical protein [Prolixibacteraceae bacterium]
MVEKEIHFRKKREIGDIVNDTFAFIKQEHRPILQLVFKYVLPFLILYGVVQVYVQMKVIGNIDFSDPEEMMANIGPIYLNIFFVSLFSLFVQSLLAGTYFSYIEIYVKRGKGNFDLNEITPLLFSNSLLVLGVSLIVFALFTFGLILCFIPGIYFANSLSLAFAIVIFEKKGIGNALSKSWRLVHSQWWNTFLINLLGVILLSAISFVLSIPSMIAGISTSIFSLKETGTLDYPVWYWVVLGASTAVTTAFWIIPYTFIAFQYFNLEERTTPSQLPLENS